MISIFDPNFIWLLVGQIVIGIIIVILFGLILNKVFDKYYPKIHNGIKFVLIALILFIMIIMIGFMSEFFF